MKQEKWLYEITPKNSLLDLNLKEVWKYRDLLILFVKRDIITVYKQTILGPLWYVIQPLFTSVIFTLIFNNVANIKTGSIPPFLFNLAGITAWNYFKECLTATSDTFKKNENIFGKVYFPRVIMPISIIISNLLKFGIQLLILILFYLMYNFKGYNLTVSWALILFPILVLGMGLLGLGLGMMISSMVTKYRDLTFLVTFGIQLLMYLSAVVYPLDVVYKKIPEYAWIVEYNPMTTVIETFRRILFNIGTIEVGDLLYMLGVSVLIFMIGLLVFNKTEKTFIDTV